MRILLVCERSAGHIFPALAIGEKLRRESTSSGKIYFFITSSFLKKNIQKKGFVVVGKSFPFRNLISEGFWRFFEAFYLIFRLRPNKVIGFGGRDSFFLVLFSTFLNIDTAIYDPNLTLGKANKVLSFFVKKIFRGFEKDTVNKKTKVIGVPLRENMRKIDKTKARNILNLGDAPVVFFFGGSQGALFINDIALRFAEQYNGPLQIIHLTGLANYLEIIELYNKMNIERFVRDFYNDIGILYSAADIVVSRSGAATLGEISFYKLPSIFVPHPQAGGHQKDNSLYFKEKGAAYVFTQDSFSFEDFSNCLATLLESNEARKKIRDRLSRIRLGVGFEDFCKKVHF